MDSKAINKLIRSEIWPVLRQFGFDAFEARNAYGRKNQFINVVNFQSFNSYNASVLGCTTYSFVVNLGVYVIGHPRQRHVKRDKSGLLLPLESECSFRLHVQKRTPVDRFEDDHIFYIDPDGRTTAACFDEVRQLASTMLPRWFEEHNDLDLLLSRMDTVDRSTSTLRMDAEGVPGSYNWNTLNCLLLLLKHAQAPNQQSAARSLESIDRMIGTILDFSTVQSRRPGEEEYALTVSDLWRRLGAYQPTPVWVAPNDRENSLESEIWAPGSAVSQNAALLDISPAPSARKEFWPALKNAGFSEFTDRLAHRVSQELVEVVEFLPMDPFERKEGKHPAGCSVSGSEYSGRSLVRVACFEATEMETLVRLQTNATSLTGSLQSTPLFPLVRRHLVQRMSLRRP